MPYSKSEGETSQVFFNPLETARRAGISRTSVYALNRKHNFIRKFGSRSLIKWEDFERALMEESKPLT